MSKVLPITLEIPNYVRKVKLSDKQRAYYFEWNGVFIKGKTKKLPISFYLDKTNIPIYTKIEDLKGTFAIGCIKNGKIVKVYRDSNALPSFEELKSTFKKCKFHLCKLVNGNYEPVLCNPKKVGTPKYYLIKGQDIYSGNLREHQKGLVMDSIKSSYFPYVKDMPVIDSYPIKITCYLYETIKNVYDKSPDLGQRWDIDNYVYPYLKAFPDLLTTLKKIKDDDRLHFPSSIPAYFVPIDNHADRKFVFVIEEDLRPEVKNHPIFVEYHRNRITGESEDNDLRDMDFDEDLNLFKKQ